MRDPIRLLLMRHAERGTSGDAGNESLSARGLQQAQNLVIPIQALGWRDIPTLLVSPKMRAQQTALPIAKALVLSIRSLDQLDECRPAESTTAFTTRVSEFIDQCTAGAFGLNVLAVSHSDWLEEAAALLLQHRIYLRWEPAQAHLFELFGSKVIHSGLITP